MDSECGFGKNWDIYSAFFSTRLGGTQILVLQYYKQFSNCKYERAILPLLDNAYRAGAIAIFGDTKCNTFNFGSFRNIAIAIEHYLRSEKGRNVHIVALNPYALFRRFL